MKKQIIFLIVLTVMFMSSSYMYAQEPSKANQQQPDTNIGKEVFTIVEVMPEYPGGENARQLYLTQNIQYPVKAKENNIQGTVYVNFIVEKDGSLSNFKILKGIGSGCDEEVVRVMKNMPKWKPGTQRGQPVRVLINFPVKFSFK
jgi:periplasmic protein TonB